MREVGPRAPERPEGSRPQLPFSSPEGGALPALGSSGVQEKLLGSVCG